MTGNNSQRDDPRIQNAITALQQTIIRQFPAATFQVRQGLGDDADGTYLMTTVDVPDPEMVTNVVIDQVLAYQIGQDLPVYVIPIRPLERIAGDLAQRQQTAPRRCLSYHPLPL
ncbi:MAG: hypothetical protein ACR2PL_03590 [Dehalococcoidia bacterium]